MADLLLAKDKMNEMKQKAQQNYDKYFELQKASARRGLRTVHDAIVRCSAYIDCMKDMEMLTEEETSIQKGYMVQEFIELENEYIIGKR